MAERSMDRVSVVLAEAVQETDPEGDRRQPQLEQELNFMRQQTFPVTC